ncbi:MAG: hypothetical protein ONB48_04250 [candidate division KSB1 bacterium]|nr:hypothetical protein [candidate division KSB1 bacterium]MDZ7274478.1 hypothetical protein [candidate division KSB1 bacterium]MDZ7284860.1 hypothetical protein [candidate division KSB1 bacterium]MDZ7297720.1 hypothetical protein [candidate division KSB1 bacterium]MDZ7308973.1 hypothetical protein [candidate division KSB1 bacterium]
MKAIRLLSVLLMLSLLPVAWAQAPGTAAATFLLIQPSLRANGMGGASVASMANDALGIMFNPARLGSMAGDNRFMAEFYPGKTIWLGALASDISYDARTFAGGYRFRAIGNRLPVSVGISYSRVALDYGNGEIPGAGDPTTVVAFHAIESAKVWTAGLRVDHVIKAGFALSLRSITSQPGPVTATGSAHDFGVLLYAPGEEIVARLTGRPWSFARACAPPSGWAWDIRKAILGMPSATLSPRKQIPCRVRPAWG